MAPRKRKVAAKTATNVPSVPPDSSFTVENFDQELRALAAQANSDSDADSALSAFSLYAPVYARIVLFLFLAAASANASRAALSPIYGEIPTGLWHGYVVGAALFIGWAGNLHVRRLLPPSRPLAHLLPLFAAYLPVTQYFLASYGLSGLLGARWGPLITETLTLLPLLGGTIAYVANELEFSVGIEDLFPKVPPFIAESLPGFGCWSVYKLAERYAAGQLLGSRPSSAAVAALRSRILRQAVLSGAYALAAPSKLLLYAVPALLHTAIFNVHVTPSPWALSILNQQLAKGPRGDRWQVLARRESVTGYLSVVDSLDQGFRVLRCDHSLLGGEWTQFLADPVAEPIYGVFVMLEAVRLIEVPEKVPDTEAKALVVGLGIGTAPAALVAHGIDTTVVEIDPAVYDLASQYFHLPPNHTAVIEDAVAYADRLAQDADGSRFDYIVHDVFTGGAEPIALFTLEFLQNLHTLLSPGGVIAINYAGDLTLTPIKAVIHTIRSVFPTCRIFREHLKEETDDQDPADFTNVVIFCTKTAGLPITFRQPVQADMLNSKTREAFLVPQHEVVDTEFRSPEEVRLVRRNDTEQLTKAHSDGALGHWTVMRRVIPSKVWEQW